MENEAVVAAEKPEGEENVDVEKENPEKEAEEVEPEEKVCSIVLQSTQVLQAL